MGEVVILAAVFSYRTMDFSVGMGLLGGEVVVTELWDFLDLLDDDDLCLERGVLVYSWDLEGNDSDLRRGTSAPVLAEQLVLLELLDFVD